LLVFYARFDDTQYIMFVLGCTNTKSVYTKKWWSVATTCQWSMWQGISAATACCTTGSTSRLVNVKLILVSCLHLGVNSQNNPLHVREALHKYSQRWTWKHAALRHVRYTVINLSRSSQLFIVGICYILHPAHV